MAPRVRPTAISLREGRPQTSTVAGLSIDQLAEQRGLYGAMVLAAFGYVEARGSGSLSTSRPWRVTSSGWSGHG